MKALVLALWGIAEVGMALLCTCGACRGQEYSTVKVYILPEAQDSQPGWAPIFSYSHGNDGKRLPGIEGRNVVKTSGGRTFAVVLSPKPYRDSTIDEVYVCDISDREYWYGKCVSMDDDEVKLRSPKGKAPFKCRVTRYQNEGMQVEVWADPLRLEQTPKDAFSIAVKDLYSWRAEKARLVGNAWRLGTKTYKVISSLIAESQRQEEGSVDGWALFDVNDLASDGKLIHPRYIVPSSEYVKGNRVTIERRQPIGDSGFFILYDSQKRSWRIEDGAKASSVTKPSDTRARSLPEIPTVPTLDGK